LPYITDLARLASTPGGRSPGENDLGTLLQATARADADAFHQVYEQLYPPVFSVIRAVLRDAPQAEEVAQEVFLEVWQLACRYDPGRGGATAWVLTIARRRAIDRVRSVTAAANRERRLAAVTYPEPVSELVEATLESEQVRRCLAHLSTVQREAIVLAFYHGHTYLQVADLLQVPLGTVKARIRDGLGKLRDAMGGGPRRQPRRQPRSPADGGMTAGAQNTMSCS
jgi:RNA polymerase sigma-70 factor (ECF subfamily)